MKSAIAIAALVLIGVGNTGKAYAADPELEPAGATYDHAVCVAVKSVGDGEAVRYCLGEECKPTLRLPKAGCLMLRRLGRTDLTIQAVDADGEAVGTKVTVTYRIDKGKVTAESFEDAELAHWWHTHGEPLVGASVPSAPARPKTAPVPAPAPAPDFAADITALRTRLGSEAAVAREYTDAAEGRGREYAGVAVAEGFRLYRGEADARYVRNPTEADNIWSLGVGPLALSVSDTGAILGGAVALEANPPSTRWAPVLRIVFGQFNDGDEKRGLFGGDLAILHPLRGGGALDLGPMFGWYGVNTDDRVLDLPTVGLTARYRLCSWLYATGMAGGTVPLDERTDGSEDKVPDVEFTLGVGLTAHL